MSSYQDGDKGDGSQRPTQNRGASPVDEGPSSTWRSNTSISCPQQTTPAPHPDPSAFVLRSSFSGVRPSTRQSTDLHRDHCDRLSADLPHDSRHYTCLQGRSTDLYTIQSRKQLQRDPSAHTGRPVSLTSTPRGIGTPRASMEERVNSMARSPVALSRKFQPAAADGAAGAISALNQAAKAGVLENYWDWLTRKQKRRKKPQNVMRNRLRKWYRKIVLEGILRRKPIPPSKDGRHIPLRVGKRKHLTDERTGKPFISNFIRSTRYTVWDFFPKQLVFQFSKLANFYFLVIGIMQMIPGLSTTGTYTTIGPLMAFVGLSMAKEGWDDYRRYRLDKVENRSDAWVLDPVKSGLDNEKRRHTGAVLDKHKSMREKPSLDERVERGVIELDGGSVFGGSGPWVKVQWQDIRVGDIIRLQRDDNVPADMVLLHATGPNGIAYIETMALDGETNLKSKQASPFLAKHCCTLNGIRQCNAEIIAEDPNADLYNFEGKAAIGDEMVPLALNQIIYRGSTMRNTAEAFGVVVNSGEECKIRMNAHKEVHAKAPAMQAATNRIIITLVIFVCTLAVGCTVGYEIWKGAYEDDAWYLERARVPFREIFLGFVIQFNTLIPLSLYVSLEVIKLGQLFLLWDVEMYHEESNTPMVANTTTILEDLGQIGYVFSDKTGTLTENLMRFRKLSVAGTAWLHDMDIRREAEKKEKKYGKGKLAKKEKEAASSLAPKSQALNRRTSVRSTAGERSLPLSSMLPKRSSSLSKWRSSGRPANTQPDLNTEDLVQYMRLKPNTTFAKKARHLILCLALCHTCLPETKDNGEIEYQAASPDELALVEGAKELGYTVIDRPPESIVIQAYDVEGKPTIERYAILDIIEFSSQRKRMSIIVRMPDGRIALFCKGADSVILPRLKLNNLAIQKASAVERRASRRKSVEQEMALCRKSIQMATPRSSIVIGGPSITVGGRSLTRRSSTRRSASRSRKPDTVTGEVDTWLRQRKTDDWDDRTGNDPAYQTPRHSTARQMSIDYSVVEDFYNSLVDESLAVNEGAAFDRCFQHIDDFASEGLRTLLYAYRYLDEEEYSAWKKVYQDATTSLVNRQERIEEAAELIEQKLDLAGATAIEDKLQQGVPETIDKLRRANIKVWMLTGDKRETAINIAHSARMCKPFSEIYILDAAAGDLQEGITNALIEVGRGMVAHSVVVIDGHTLGIVEADESLKTLFFDLVTRIDAVICCRASPSQKASLVKCIRHTVPSAVTLAIGDGANDIAMIQASQIGIGISGREGLQAARISDYSIAQFRFLQKLLFVHGRWNYMRTAKYILATFWKELVFFQVQALYQRYNGYTGTSLYEPTSLTVFNVLFTSLPVIILGIFEQDLNASTLLAVPELYTYGQRSQAFNFKKYVAWMFMAATEAVMIYLMIYEVFRTMLFTSDTTLYAMGTLAFTVCVVFINIKMLVLEMHTQTIITFGGLFISVAGWFLWSILLTIIYGESFGPYIIRDAFLHNFGATLKWWTTCGVVLAAPIVFEISIAALRRSFLPTDEDRMQAIERYDGVLDVMREHAMENGDTAPIAAEEGAASTPRSSADAVSFLDSVDATGGAVDRRTSETGRASGEVNCRSTRLEEEHYGPPPFTPPSEERDCPSASSLVLDADVSAVKSSGSGNSQIPTLSLGPPASPLGWKATPHQHTESPSEVPSPRSQEVGSTDQKPLSHQ